MLNFRFLLRTDRHQCEGRGLERVVEDACAAGLRAVCLQELDLTPRLLWHLAEKIAAVCRRYQTRLFLSERVDLALAVGASGVVLTPDSMPVASARKAMPGALVGLMIRSADQAVTSGQDPPDFLLFGPVFERFDVQKPGSKHRLADLQQTAEVVDVPVFAFGGVTPLNVVRCIEAGAYGVSMMSMVMSSPNVGLLVESYQRALGEL
jgi:thiamine-phosphate pyrophosphorylase